MMLIYTSKKQPPKVMDGFSAIFAGEIPRLFFGKYYAWSVVPDAPKRETDKDYFNKRVMEWLVK